MTTNNLAHKISEYLADEFRRMLGDSQKPPAPVSVSLNSAEAAQSLPEPPPLPEMPPLVIPSFAERVQELTRLLDDALLTYSPIKEPENLVVVDYYNRTSQGTEYLGKLYMDPTTGKNFKFVTHDNKVIPCYLGKDFL